jgi:putative endopeptidase
MDTRAIEAAGVTPIRPILDRIDAIATADDVVRYLRDEFAAGRGEVFSFGPQADMKQASMVIAYASQGGPRAPGARLLPRGRQGRRVREDSRRVRRAPRPSASKRRPRAGRGRATGGRRARVRDAPRDGITLAGRAAESR